MIWFAALLSLVGGMMDSYSYTVRGGVFATGQTGNIVLLAVGLKNHEVPRIFRSIVSITAFCSGIIFAKHLFHVLTNQRKGTLCLTSIKSGVLLIESVCLFFIGTIPNTMVEVFPNSLLSFVAAVQYSSFRHLENGITYASVFCTGNISSCAEYYYTWIILRDREGLRKAFYHTLIILSFWSGAFVEIFLAMWLGKKSIWASAAITAICSLLLRRHMPHSNPS